jgi:hypothetical protein
VRRFRWFAARSLIWPGNCGHGVRNGSFVAGHGKFVTGDGKFVVERGKCNDRDVLRHGPIGWWDFGIAHDV